jgi:hypothetical protein
MCPEGISGALARSVLIDPASLVGEEDAVVVLLLQETDHLERTHVHYAAESVYERLAVHSETVGHTLDIPFTQKDITGFAAAAVTAALTLERKSSGIETTTHLTPLKPS